MQVLKNFAPGKNSLSQDDSIVVRASERLPALTSLRFFAALMIILCHAASTFDFPFADRLRNLALHQGVSFFFVLSGFILFHVHKDLSGNKRMAKFLISRFGRVWPAHVGTAVLAVVLLAIDPWQPSHSRLPWITCANLAMVHAWIPRSPCYFSLNAPSWSISTEFFFYLCFPLLVTNWQQTYVRKIILSLAMALGCIVSAMVLQNNGRQSLGDSQFHWLLYISPIARLFEFVLGMTICYCFHRFKKWAHMSFVRSTLIEASILALIALNLVFNPILTNCNGENVSTQAILFWLRYCGGAPIYALLIVIMAYQNGLFSKLLSLPVFVFLGEISYSIYLTHWIFLQYFSQHSSSFLQLPMWQSALLYFSVVLISSYAIYTFIETFFRQLIMKLSDKILC